MDGPAEPTTSQHSRFHHGWTILPTIIGYCTNTQSNHRFQCEDNNIRATSLRSRVASEALSPNRRSIKALFLSNWAHGAMPKQRQYRLPINLQWPTCTWLWDGILGLHRTVKCFGYKIPHGETASFITVLAYRRHKGWYYKSTDSWSWKTTTILRRFFYTKGAEETYDNVSLLNEVSIVQSTHNEWVLISYGHQAFISHTAWGKLKAPKSLRK